jgi:hypothetical protein
VVTREEYRVLGKNKMAPGREEAFKARVVRLSDLLVVFLRSRPCSTRLSALHMSV